MSKQSKSLLDLSPKELHKLKQYANALTKRAQHKEASAADGTQNPITSSAAHGSNVAIQKHDKLNKLIQKKLGDKHMNDLSPMEQIKLKSDAHKEYLKDNKSPLSEAHESHKVFKPAAYSAHGATVHNKAGQLTQQDTAGMGSFDDGEDTGYGGDLADTYMSDVDKGGDNFASNIANAGGALDDLNGIIGVSQFGNDISRIKNNLSSEDAQKLKEEVQQKYKKHEGSDTELYNTDHTEQHRPILDDEEARGLFSSVNNNYAEHLQNNKHHVDKKLKNHGEEYGQAVQEGIASAIKKFYPNHEHKDSNEIAINKHVLNHASKAAESIHNRLSTDPIAYRFGIKKYNSKKTADSSSEARSLSPEEIKAQYGDATTPIDSTKESSAPTVEPSSAAGEVRSLSPEEIKAQYGSLPTSMDSAKEASAPAQAVEPAAEPAAPKVDVTPHLDEGQNKRFDSVKGNVVIRRRKP